MTTRQTLSTPHAETEQESLFPGVYCQFVVSMQTYSYLVTRLIDAELTHNILVQFFVSEYLMQHLTYFMLGIDCQ